MFFKIFLGAVILLLVTLCIALRLEISEIPLFVNTEIRKENAVIVQPQKEKPLIPHERKEIPKVVTEVKKECISYMITSSGKICVPQGIPVERKDNYVITAVQENKVDIAGTVNPQIFSGQPDSLISANVGVEIMSKP